MLALVVCMVALPEAHALGQSRRSDSNWVSRLFGRSKPTPTAAPVPEPLIDGKPCPEDEPETNYPLGALTEERDGLKDSPGAKTLLDLIADKKVNEAPRRNRELRRTLTEDPLLLALDKNGNERCYYRVMKRGPTMKFLLGGDAGVSEGYTIGEHTTRVLAVFAKQKGFLDLSRVHVPFNVNDLKHLLEYTLIFHDIGKSIAVHVGDKNLEEHFSAPLVERFMAATGFNNNEAAIARELVESHQLIGSFLKGNRSAPDVADDVVASAGRCKMAPIDFYRLLEAVFIADAGAYPSLQARIFKKSAAGKLSSNARNYFDLGRAIRAWRPKPVVPGTSTN